MNQKPNQIIHGGGPIWTRNAKLSQNYYSLSTNKQERTTLHPTNPPARRTMRNSRLGQPNNRASLQYQESNNVLVNWRQTRKKHQETPDVVNKGMRNEVIKQQVQNVEYDELTRRERNRTMWLIQFRNELRVHRKITEARRTRLTKELLEKKAAYHRTREELRHCAARIRIQDEEDERCLGRLNQGNITQFQSW